MKKVIKIIFGAIPCIITIGPIIFLSIAAMNKTVGFNVDYVKQAEFKYYENVCAYHLIECCINYNKEYNE